MVAEILDPRTKQLIQLSGCADYVVSSELIAMCLAQAMQLYSTSLQNQFRLHLDSKLIVRISRSVLLIECIAPCTYS